MRAVLVLIAVTFLPALAQDDAASTLAGQWQIDRATDEWAPGLNAVLHVEANERRGGVMGGEAVRFLLRCRDDGMDALILWSPTGGSMSLRTPAGTSAVVSVRIDDGAPETSNWDVTVDNRATAVPQEMMPALLERLSGAETLTARVESASRGELQARFPVGGLREALALAGDECSY